MGDNGKIVSSRDFFAKYGLAEEGGMRLDRDPALPGVQNPQFAEAEIATDYNSLSPEEKYAVFTLLKKNGETELLKKLIDRNIYSENLEDVSVRDGIARYFGDLKSFADRIRGMKEEGHDIWDARLQLAYGLYVYGSRMEDIHGRLMDSGFTPGEIEGVRSDAAEGLAQLYRDIGPRYWDSDGDSYFDRSDADPYDPDVNIDTDGDGAGDSIDDRAEDGREWSDMKPGESFKSQWCDVRRGEDGGFEITIRIHLKPSDECRDGEAIRKKIADPAFRAAKAGEMEKFFSDHLAGDASGFRLNVEFVEDEDSAHRVVKVTDKVRKGENFRSNAGEWHISVFDHPGVPIHETMHLLGLPDLYHEGLVHGMMRDHTFSPGFTELEPDNIMGSDQTTSLIYGRDLKYIVSSARKQIVRNAEAGQHWMEAMEESRAGGRDAETGPASQLIDDIAGLFEFREGSMLEESNGDWDKGMTFLNRGLDLMKEEPQNVELLMQLLYLSSHIEGNPQRDKILDHFNHKSVMSRLDMDLMGFVERRFLDAGRYDELVPTLISVARANPEEFAMGIAVMVGGQEAIDLIDSIDRSFDVDRRLDRIKIDILNDMYRTDEAAALFDEYAESRIGERSGLGGDALSERRIAIAMFALKLGIPGIAGKYYGAAAADAIASGNIDRLKYLTHMGVTERMALGDAGLSATYENVCKEILKKDPYNMDAYMELVWNAYEHGDREKAVGYLDRLSAVVREIEDVHLLDANFPKDREEIVERFHLRGAGPERCADFLNLLKKSGLLNT